LRLRTKQIRSQRHRLDKATASPTIKKHDRQQILGTALSRLFSLWHPLI
jgi:hypothetical protein